MRFLARLVLVPLALLFAVPAGAAALFMAAVFDPVLHRLGADLAEAGFGAMLDALAALEPPERLSGPVAGVAMAAFALLVAPPAFIGLIGEVAGFRAFLWYAGATGILTALLPWLTRTALRPATPDELRIAGALFVGGTVAGAVYWLIAGSSSGRRPLRRLAGRDANLRAP